MRHPVFVCGYVILQFRIASQKVVVHGPVSEVEDIFPELLRDLEAICVWVVSANRICRKRPIEMEMVTVEGREFPSLCVLRMVENEAVTEPRPDSCSINRLYGFVQDVWSRRIKLEEFLPKEEVNYEWMSHPLL